MTFGDLIAAASNQTLSLDLLQRLCIVDESKSRLYVLHPLVSIHSLRLSLSLHSLCLSLHSLTLSVCLSLFTHSVCLFTCSLVRSVCLFVDLSVCRSVCLSLHSLTVCLSLFTHSSTCICLSVSLWASFSIPRDLRSGY